MITEQMKELIQNSSAIRAMFEEGKKMAAAYGAENVFDFSLGNPSVVPPDSVKKVIYDILEKEDPMSVHGYMNNAGYEDVRQEIAGSINQKYNTSYRQENIIMTAGAAGALNIVLRSILDPSDEVIIFAPFFGEYKNYIANYRGTAVIVPPQTKDFQPNLDAFEKLITPKTKAVIINSPNNPTGVIYKEETLKRLAQILTDARKKTGQTILLISDEPYREIVYNNHTVCHLPTLYPHTVIAYSYSKTLSLPGERTGYLLIPETLEDAAAFTNACTVSLRILGYVNAPSLFQKVQGRLAADTADLSVYERNKNTLYQHLTGLGFSCIEPEGAFYLFPKALEEDCAAFCAQAKKLNLLLVPGRSFGCPGYFRLAYCVDEAMIQRSLQAFEKLAQRYGGK